MTKTNAQQESYKNFCQYDANDRKYHGATEIVEAELDCIKQRRPDATSKNLTGLALSGGGIRSASFSLGVMQALARKEWLKRFDYLSTVSGGGYIGSSLSWLLHKPWDCTDVRNESCNVQFGLDEDTFPFKTEPVWSTKETASTTSANVIPPNVKGSMLRWLRQNGKYLTPGGFHNFAALMAAVLRGSIISLFVYLALLILLFQLLNFVGAFKNVTWCFSVVDCGGLPVALVVAGWGVGLFVLLALGYSVATFLFSFSETAKPPGAKDTAPSANQASKGGIINRYCLRRCVESILGVLLLILLGLAAIGLIPLIPVAVQILFKQEVKDTITTVMSVVSALAGICSSIGVFAQSNKRKKSKWMPVLVGVATVLLAFGILLLAYQIAVVYWPKSLCLLFGALAIVVVIGWFCNLNYVAVHRYYRDRLMETFMPDVAEAVLAGSSRPGAAFAADRTSIQEMCGGNAGACGPYHLVNTNIVLVESKKPKFKGRGGDNFILSPYFCGSNATGWRASHEFMDGGMTFATAMAISGAAVNPSAGCGGEGVTRQPILSMLMGLLNVRLGYWAPNPNPAKHSPFGSTPNFILPGLAELVLRKNLNEDSWFVQLSDGGHFENLGLYELLRRRVKVIVVCDGGADPDFTFSDLANAIEKARVDFGTLISIESKDLAPLVPQSGEMATECECPEKFAARGHLVADIYYPDDERGKLIYLTTTFTRNLSADLYGYRKEHPEFPDEPTGDQFFDEKQFEAYRELGFQLAWSMIDDVSNDLNEIVRATARAR